MSKRTRLLDLISNIPDHKIHSVFDQIVPILERNLEKDDESIVIMCCPHCGSVSIKKNGTSKGVQRYLCKDCHKTFISKTNTFLFHNRISDQIWLDFIDYEFAGMTLKEESHFLKLSVHTCFRMRHKLYAAVSAIIENDKVEGTVQIDATFQKINLKGTKPQNMPRFSKKRGKTSSLSKNNHHKICIVSGIDTKDNMFMQITGLGNESIEKYNSCRFKFGEATLFISDSHQSIQGFANSMGVKTSKIPPSYIESHYQTENGETLAETNQLHSEISTLITRTHGFSTKYMQQYLDFIVFKKKVKYSNEREDISRIIYDQIKKTKAFSEAELVYADYPISLKEAYYEYRYGIFA